MERPTEDHVLLACDETLNSSLDEFMAIDSNTTGEDIKTRKTFRSGLFLPDDRLDYPLDNTCPCATCFATWLDGRVPRAIKDCICAAGANKHQTKHYSLWFLGAKPCADPDWETWRNSLHRVVGGHTISGLLGYGNDKAPNHYFKKFLGLLPEETEVNWFVKRARSHGKDKEIVAKKALLESEFAFTSVNEYYESESLTYQIVHEASGQRLDVCVTPDLISGDREECVIEIKAPYHGSDKFESAAEFRDFCNKKNLPKYGVSYNPGWFLQSAFYAWILGLDYFKVVIIYYCTRTDEFILAEYEYLLVEKLRHFFNTQIGHLLEKVHEFDTSTDEKTKKKLYKPFEGLDKTKKTVVEWMRNSVISSWSTERLAYDDLTGEIYLISKE
jgi:hypothetical protein